MVRLARLKLVVKQEEKELDGEQKQRNIREERKNNNIFQLLLLSLLFPIFHKETRLRKMQKDNISSSWFGIVEDLSTDFF